MILAIIVIGSIVLLQRTRDYSDLVIHSQAVANRVAAIDSLVRQAESGQRGFLLTQDHQYLAPYGRSVAQLPVAIAQLHSLLGDDPQRQAMLTQLQKMVDAKMAELKSTVEAQRSGDHGKAFRIVDTDVGFKLMTDIDQQTRAMLDSIGAELTKRTDAARASGVWAVLLDVVAALMLAGVALLSIATVSRFIAALHGARRELEATNENLEMLVADRTSELRNANEELQRYAYIVSHDLRSPLVNIMGFTSELEAVRGDIHERIARDNSLDAEAYKPIDKDLAESIGFIKSSTSKMDRLISAILKLAREGRRRFVGERLSMQELVGSIVDSVAHRAHEAGTRITIGMLPPLTSDRTAVEQVFSNLIDNAVKYLDPARPGEVNITGREIGSMVVYEVRDNGRGIDPRDHQRIFELFRRSGAQDVAGEGIGLAHVRASVRSLGGTIALESGLGQGALFRLTFPKKWTEPEEQGV
ncbi:MAG TPA: CHASE3 domain-containing protein [Stellaceae bacterium]|nr:CHASE3 domain-containing protein [Stellaceae bacterium]